MGKLIVSFFFIVGNVYAESFIEAYIECAQYRKTDGTIIPYRLQAGTHNLGDSGVIGEQSILSELATGFYNATLKVTNSEGAFDTDNMFFSATGLKGDFDLDGDVDGEDLGEFSENFGW